MREQTRFRPLPAFALFALSLPGALLAQLPSIGLSEVGSQWFQNDDPTNTESDADDFFGGAFAVGDFNGDGVDDLATGVHGDDGSPFGVVEDNGSVVVRYGGAPAGLEGGQVTVVLRQSPEGAFVDEFFGATLAAGNFNGDAYDDLAVGVPGNEGASHGAVYVYFGNSTGFEAVYEMIDEIECGGAQHVCDPGQFSGFGSSLAVGNFEGDDFDDLAIGNRHDCERVGNDLVQSSGSVYVAHGREWGLLPFLGYRISQNEWAIFGDAEEYDFFGSSVAAGDFNGDTYDDLAIGIPGEDEGGAIEIVMGSPFQLLFEQSVFWFPEALGDVSEPDDEYAHTLATGDFDGDGFDDLAVGTPYESLGPGDIYVGTGQVTIAYGAADVWFDLSRCNHIAQSTLYGEIQEADLDFFGSALAAGDFDGDGSDDLAIAHPGDDWSGSGRGAVTILMGSGTGLGGSGRFRLLQTGLEGVPGNANQFFQFAGDALGTGDFDDNGFADLAIGVPNFNFAPASDIGGEAILYGALFADGFELGSANRWSNAEP